MPILVLSNDEIRKLLPTHECVTVMRDALDALAAGEWRSCRTPLW
ncbi:hypothetical protein [Micromonospora tarapacensis]|nr:hypothetical protein [Micromonospora tarapacensis]